MTETTEATESTDVSGSLVRFALSGGSPVPDGLRSAVSGLPAPSPAAQDEHLAALRSAYPQGDLRAQVLDTAAGLTCSGVHPLVAAIAAVAGLRNAARAEEATVLGCEVACRLAASLDVRPDALSVVGAALAGSTDPVGGLHALGLAATQTTTVGGSSDEQKETAALRAAFAAADGAEAALLGERGFTAPRQPLEGRRGLLALLAPAADAQELVRGLGTRWFAEAVL